jgi:beta-glucosidase
MAGGRKIPVYRQDRRPVSARVADLIGRMTPVEKVAQLRAAWLKLLPDGGVLLHDRMTDRGQTPWTFLKDGIGQVTRPFGTHPVAPRAAAGALNAVQKFLVDSTRLGIPSLPHDECLSGFMAQGATQFPTPLNLGATWDPELIREMATVIGRQMRAVGSRQGLSPVADVIRDARWGRVEECMGEDPYHVGMMVTRYVEGLQAGLPDGVIATLKHYGGHSFGEGGRNLAPVHVGPRELADVFLLPFEMAVKIGGCRSVMSAYHDIDGVPASASYELLTEILRRRWGFKGTVVADYNVVRYLRTKHRIAADKAAAATAAVSAGMDVELPTSEYFGEGLIEALKRGIIRMSAIDQALRRVLTQKFELGLFENPYVDVDRIVIDTAADRDVARRIAERSLVLLKNDGILPLGPDLKRVAVIGPNADEQMALFGNYNFPTNVFARYRHDEVPKFAPTVLEAIKARLGDNTVAFARGVRILTGVHRPVSHPESGPAPDPTIDPISRDVSGIPEAVALARNSEVAVLVVGDRAGHFQTGTVGEGTDVDDIGLTAAQDALVEAVLDTGTPTVLVLVAGRPQAIGKYVDRAAAILEAWFPGQEGAAAIAAVLSGAVNPSGKTSVSFSRSAGAQPFYYNHKTLSAGLPLLPHFGAVFPFGHGLSYTRFDYADLRISRARVPVDGAVSIACTVTNAGARDGDEVVQLYVRDEVASLARPERELKGFQRLTLAAGEAKRVRFELPADMLGFHGLDGRRVVEPGAIAVMIGASSADIRLNGTFTLTGKPRRVPERCRLWTPAVVEPTGSAPRARPKTRSQGVKR